MKEKVKKLWVKALKSGKYKQAKNYLCAGGRHCCLGVLCELYNKEMKKNNKKTLSKTTVSIETNHKPKNVEQFGKDVSVLPNKVQKWAGMKTAVGYLPNHRHLADLNDSGVKFKRIAKIIEINGSYL